MTKLNIDTLGKLSVPLGLALGVPYIYCMFLYPWLGQNGSWEHVQNVWDRWQTFNAATLAFAATVVALQITRYSDVKQNERDFRTAKAFLPAAFSELTSYFKASAATLREAWSLQSQPQHITAPEAPNDYKETFKECIRHAPPEVGDYLADMLVDLQVHEARMRTLNKGEYTKNVLISYLRSLAHLNVRLNKQFDYARHEQEFDQTPLAWEDFKNVYSSFQILSGNIEAFHDEAGTSLKSMTDKLIARLNKETQ